ncbi:MAG: DUF1080 domain-containing protein [Planctomycetales bacterium]|nr:DUF1080 domain-containing protein [Planctomycetales bacterium]
MRLTAPVVECFAGQRTWLRTIVLINALCIFIGCDSKRQDASVVPGPDVQDAAVQKGDSTAERSEQQESAPSTKSTAKNLTQPATSEIVLNADKLLAAALPEAALVEGWVRLFDTQTLHGWSIVGDANWQIADGSILVDAGEQSYLCTNLSLSNYELKVDFRSDAQTNSGVFLRTQPEPTDVAEECLELNIAPPDNPSPTGSFVQRKKLEPSDLGDFDPTQWHTYHIRLDGDHVSVRLDDRLVMELEDSSSLRPGHISLQHNSGRVEFRNVLLRPISGQTLKLGDDWETDWTKSEKESDQLAVEVKQDGLHLQGGLGQLQSKSDWDNFILQASYTLAKPEVNSGIFFRCIRDNMLDGYECQVNHSVINNDPMSPGDAGAGAIFRRQAARMVVGDGTQPTFLTLLAKSNYIYSWVNGIPVCEFFDQREADENPRRGLRLAAGPISLQGHDPTTDVIYHRLSISRIE